MRQQRLAAEGREVVRRAYALPAGLLAATERAAAAADRSMGSIIAEALTDWLAARDLPTDVQPQAPGEAPDAVGLTEAANMLGITRQRLHQLIGKGQLVAERLPPAPGRPSGRLAIARGELERFGRDTGRTVDWSRAEGDGGDGGGQP